jgi:hypothetical protein
MRARVGPASMTGRSFAMDSFNGQVNGRAPRSVVRYGYLRDDEGVHHDLGGEQGAAPARPTHRATQRSFDGIRNNSTGSVTEQVPVARRASPTAPCERQNRSVAAAAAANARKVNATPRVATRPRRQPREDRHDAGRK